MGVVLGLNIDHADASACVVRDGRIVAALAEERLGPRVKHSMAFPALAVSRVLELARVGVRDVDVVAVAHSTKANITAKARYVAAHPAVGLRAVRNVLGRERRQADLREQIERACGQSGATFAVEQWEHHVAHAASSYFTSGFDAAASLTYDGSGDFVSALSGVFTDGNLKVLRRVYLPHSLGHCYTAVCQLLGFARYGEEYKVMGLAAYGTPKHKALFDRVLRSDGRGGFTMDTQFFLQSLGHAQIDTGDSPWVPTLFSSALVDALGPVRLADEPLEQRHKDIAASIQAVFEDVVLDCARWLRRESGADALVTAGGCALNGVSNARLQRDSGFSRYYIHGAAGDDGTAVGAALLSWRARHGFQVQPRELNGYWGASYDDDEIARALAAAGVTARRLGTEDLLRETAQLLNAGRVVGWFQGRSEWGPRALGNRSILAHPGWPGMKDLINAKVKRRESFRPFAPSILADRVSDYFAESVESPFMMHVVPIRAERREALAAVTHEDGTGRMQTVQREQNPLYYDLIQTFAGLSGTPVVLNTSFNENEPIVEEPRQAIDCFLRTEIDALAIGAFLAVKSR